MRSIIPAGYLRDLLKSIIFFSTPSNYECQYQKVPGNPYLSGLLQVACCLHTFLHREAPSISWVCVHTPMRTCRTLRFVGGCGTQPEIGSSWKPVDQRTVELSSALRAAMHLTIVGEQAEVFSSFMLPGHVVG